MLLVVDDTLAACGNLAAVSFSDLLVTSLTKNFSGYGNVLAGSLVVNPQGAHASKLTRQIRNDFEETLSDVDIAVLCKNSADFKQRVATINDNAFELAEFLRQHPKVESVYYPQRGDANYEALRTDNGGYGGLLSIVLREAADRTPGMFDALNVCKGPNLGTAFTLCCPYTILAHYTELDFAESCGVSRWLLRVSVGLEPSRELIRRFDAAIQAVF